MRLRCNQLTSIVLLTSSIPHLNHLISQSNLIKPTSQSPRDSSVPAGLPAFFHLKYVNTLPWPKWKWIEHARVQTWWKCARRHSWQRPRRLDMKVAKFPLTLTMVRDRNPATPSICPIKLHFCLSKWCPTFFLWEQNVIKIIEKEGREKQRFGNGRSV